MHPLITARYPALGFPLFRRYWLASFASVGATQLITLGQGWLIFELTGSALQLGVLGAAAAAPNILMTFAGGVIADRFDKRRILMCTSLANAALLAFLDASGLVAVWHVLAVAALFSLITGLDWPVRVSLYPRLVDRGAFMSAVALNSFIWQASRMAIPAAGGLIIGVTDTAVVFTLAASGFFVMFAVMLVMPLEREPSQGGSAWGQVVEGMRFIRREPLFRWLIAATFVGMLCSQSFNQIMPVFADLMNSGETGFGYLLSAGGVGSVAGTLVIGGVTRFRRLGAMMLGAAGLAAATVMVFAALADAGFFAMALAAMFVGALFNSVFMISSMTAMQLRVPDRLRGRVMGIHSMGFSFMPLGGLLLGALAERLGAAPAVWVGSGIYLAMIVWMTMAKPVIRSLDGRSLADGSSPPDHQDPAAVPVLAGAGEASAHRSGNPPGVPQSMGREEAGR